jgi:hypothetical protein
MIRRTNGVAALPLYLYDKRLSPVVNSRLRCVSTYGVTFVMITTAILQTAEKWSNPTSRLREMIA